MTNGGPGRFYFNTAALPARDRFPMFCEELMRRYARLDVRIEDQARFAAELQQRQLGAVNIGRNSTTALACLRTPELLRDGVDKLYITLLETGTVQQSQCGSERTVGAGEAIICDGAYAGECNFTAASRHWHIHMPRQKFANLLPGDTRFAGAKLDGDVTARRLLFNYLQATSDVDLSGGSDITRLCEDHVIDLIALALGATGDNRQQAEDRGARAARLSAVLCEIERRSGNQCLSAASVAAQLGVTPRYVHLLLEETGRSFTRHLLERRLQKAAARFAAQRSQDRRYCARSRLHRPVAFQPQLSPPLRRHAVRNAR